MEGFREVNMWSVREEVLREKEELRARAKALEKRRRELMMELEEARQAKEKAEEKRREVEERWTIKVEEMEQEQELKLQALLIEIQALKEREEETEKEWRCRMAEVRKEVEESWAEFSISFSSTRVKAAAAMLEDQKTHISSLASERGQQREMDGQRRGRDDQKNDEEKAGGEVSRRRHFSLSKKQQ